MSGQTIINLGGTFIFPLPTEIGYKTSYGWDRHQFGAGIGGAFDDAMQGKFSDGQLKATGVVMAQSLIGDAGTSVQRSQGVYPSPKEAILFKGTSYREYSLSFRIAGESAGEVSQKIKYVNEMQKNAAPDMTGDSVYFVYPEIGTLEIQDSGKPIIKKRNVAVTSIDVNLTPDGFFATWADGTPLSFSVTIGFMETELPTKANDADIFG